MKFVRYLCKKRMGKMRVITKALQFPFQDGNHIYQSESNSVVVVDISSEGCGRLKLWLIRLSQM